MNDNGINDEFNNCIIALDFTAEVSIPDDVGDTS